jgi:hypothetical protein
MNINASRKYYFHISNEINSQTLHIRLCTCSDTLKVDILYSKHITFSTHQEVQFSEFTRQVDFYVLNISSLKFLKPFKLHLKI